MALRSRTAFVAAPRSHPVARLEAVRARTGAWALALNDSLVLLD